MIYSSDREVIQDALNWLIKGYQVNLITVLKTWGSSPRPVGSIMAIRDDGYSSGSVSGGCVEDELIVRIKQKQLPNSTPTIIDFGSTAEEAAQLNLPCGGRIELLVENLINTNSHLDTILQQIDSGKLICRTVSVSTGKVSLEKASSQSEFCYHQNHVNKIYGPGWKILIIGAGHLTQYVSQIAIMLDYSVSVCDPREDFQKSWPIKEIDVLNIMPDDAVVQLNNYRRSIVLSLSHDPKLDDMALMEALTLNCFYVGALGSKANNNKRRQRLATLGLTSKQLQQLHGPVGIDIGSHTPAEIAVSIMADITATRNTSASSTNDTEKKVSSL